MTDDVFKALADPTRRTILDELTERRTQTLFEICARLTTTHGLRLSRQAVSQHLGVLEAAGLVETHREGRYKYHRLNRTPLEQITERWLRPSPHHARTESEADTVNITLTSVYVNDQEAALRFYTDLLGFTPKTDTPVGEDRWLTVVPPGGQLVELLLEPASHPAVQPYREALMADGIPAASFSVSDIAAEHARLEGAGVRFTQAPLTAGPVTTAVFDDTCGNLIQLVEPPAA